MISTVSGLLRVDGADAATERSAMEEARRRQLYIDHDVDVFAATSMASLTLPEAVRRHYRIVVWIRIVASFTFCYCRIY